MSASLNVSDLDVDAHQQMHSMWSWIRVWGGGPTSITSRPDEMYVDNSVDMSWHQMLTIFDNSWQLLTSVDSRELVAGVQQGPAAFSRPPLFADWKSCADIGRAGRPTSDTGHRNLLNIKLEKTQWHKDAMTQRHTVDMVERWRATSIGLCSK